MGNGGVLACFRGQRNQVYTGSAGTAAHLHMDFCQPRAVPGPCFALLCPLWIIQRLLAFLYCLPPPGCCPQCESRCQVRPCLPPPAKGALPLPVVLPQQLRQQLEYRPTRIEDLNCLLPSGHKQLGPTQPDPRVRGDL